MLKEKICIRKCSKCGKRCNAKNLTQGICIDCNIERDKRMKAMEIHLEVDGKTLAKELVKESEPVVCYNSTCTGRNIYSWTCELKGENCKHRIKEDNKLKIEEIKDNIKPNYYHKGNIDTIKFCMENNLDFMQGNIVKYVVRYKEKNGLEDLNKAMEYLKRLIESEVK